MRYLMFTVSEKSWIEHEKVGIAAINDPAEINPTARNKEAMRQSAISEVAGIKEGDIIFFYVMGTKKILGVYEATTRAYYNKARLTPNFSRIIREMYRTKYKKKPHIFNRINFNRTHPFRVGFRKIIDFPNPISIDDLWAGRDEGKIWTIQQSRGDAVGVHACINFSKKEGEAIIRMFKESNINYKEIKTKKPNIKNISRLLIDIENENGVFRFERTPQSFLLEDFSNNKHINLFGNYDNFLVNVPTSSRKEIDILLLKHDKEGVICYQILELQKDEFDMEHINRLVLYEQWIRRTKEKGNPRNVYSVAIAADFDNEVIEYVKNRPRYNEKIIRLIKYSYNAQKNKIDLIEVTP